MQNGPTLLKQKQQQSLSIYLSTFAHVTELQNKGLTKIYEKWIPFIWQTGKKQNKTKDTNKKNTAKQRVKIVVHLENGTCRKLMPYHEDPDCFLRNHSAVKNIFTYFIKECFRNMEVHFPCPTILILLFFEKIFEIQFSFLHY